MVDERYCRACALPIFRARLASATQNELLSYMTNSEVLAWSPADCKKNGAKGTVHDKYRAQLMALCLPRLRAAQVMSTSILFFVGGGEKKSVLAFVCVFLCACVCVRLCVVVCMSCVAAYACSCVGVRASLLLAVMCLS